DGGHAQRDLGPSAEPGLDRRGRRTLRRRAGLSGCRWTSRPERGLWQADGSGPPGRHVPGANALGIALPAEGQRQRPDEDSDDRRRPRRQTNTATTDEDGDEPTRARDAMRKTITGTGGMLLIQTLKDAGVEYLFTNPGSAETGIFAALAEDGDQRLVV